MKANLKLSFVDEQGAVTELKGLSPLKAGEVIDSSTLSLTALKAFVADAIAEAKAAGVFVVCTFKGNNDESF
ncbi:Isocitrate dehydrogenase [NADP] [Sphingobacterium multivorum]|uniref:Isocitrate dehydrogenase [NADP] n=1 Tax=Sphingobacterium multivorum TaxID=28454 RepID=A0A2X2IUS6_SPHMU|nr:Isocitrate dehydrogenase [NADP] [Sphingobacterium multivorum]